MWPGLINRDPFRTCSRFCCRNTTANQPGSRIRKIFRSDWFPWWLLVISRQFPPLHVWVQDDPCFTLFTRKTAEHALLGVGEYPTWFESQEGRGMAAWQRPSKGHGHSYSVSHAPHQGPVPDSVLVFCKMFLCSRNTFGSFSSKQVTRCAGSRANLQSHTAAHTVSLTRMQWIPSYCSDSEKIRKWAGIWVHAANIESQINWSHKWVLSWKSS